VRALAAGSDCAITAFDNRASLICDFTGDTTKLLEAIETLRPRGGTDYDAGMLSEEIGGIPLASTGRFKKVLVFLTDGIGNGRTQQMIDDAISNGVTIYCVSLGMSMPDALRRVSEETGGLWFDNVTTIEQAEMAYRRIHADAVSPSICFVDLDVSPSCSKNRSIVLRVGRDSVRRSVVAPDSSLSDVRLSPLSLHFEKYAPPQQVTLRAGVVPVTLTSVKITSLSPVRITINEADLVFPISIAANDSLVLSVSCDHTDSLYSVGRIQLESMPCPLPSIYTSAGKPYRRPIGRTINVVYPNGGERIPARTKFDLLYDGVPSDLPVRVEISFDLGHTWTLIADKATGHSVPWDAPSISSDSCLLRVSQIVSDEIRMQPVAATRMLRIEQIDFLGDGKRFVVSGLSIHDTKALSDSAVRVHDAATGELYRTFPGVRFARALNDEALLTWGLNGQLHCFDLLSGNERWTMSIAPSAQLISVSQNTKGTMAFVLGGWDERPRVIDCVSGLTIARLPKDTKEIDFGVMSGDGSQVALICKDSSLQLYDSRSGRLLHKLTTAPIARLYRTAFSPDGSKIEHT
ncbi:MAG: VWA domain-containing protein, partial [Candidatus Kapabacteria bacterium]|nr:VWA domain-containing protein [Candidatus Kapabacteria bacterium]